MSANLPDQGRANHTPDWWSSPPGTDLLPPMSDGWFEPASARDRERRALRRLRSGFALLGLALVVATMSTLGFLIMLFARQRGRIGALLGIPQWDLIEPSLVVFGSTLGVALLCGRWPDRRWARRSGLLLAMCLVDCALWVMEHGVEVGLTGVEVGHEWLRRALGEAIGWSEFILIASLAGEMAGRLGHSGAPALATAVRSLAMTGATVWLMFFYAHTNWDRPIWPLRVRGLDLNTFLLFLAWLFFTAVNLIQVTILTMLAGRVCGQTLRQMAYEDRRNRDDFGG